MPNYCCVYGCKNNSALHPYLSFYSLPEDKERKRKWIDLIDRGELFEKNSKFYRVCSAHFSKEMVANRKLKSGAIPTLNLPGSNDLLTSSISPKKDAEIQVDKPVIIKTKQIKTPTTKDSSTQMTKTSQEKQTQTFNQCQCICSTKNNLPILKSITTQTESNITSKAHETISQNTKQDIQVQTSPRHYRHTVEPKKFFFASPNKKKTIATGVQTAKVLSENTPGKRILRQRLHKSELNVKKLKNELSDLYKNRISGIKRKLMDKIEEIEIKRKKKVDSDQNNSTSKILGKKQSEVSSKKNKENRNQFTTENFIDKFYEWQKKLKIKYQGNRYDKELKLFAMNIYFNSPQNYRLLEKLFALPSVRTIQRMKMIFRPGVSKDLIKLLASRLTKLSSNHKYCVLCLDEMVLKKNLFYDIRNDEIIGFHNIDGNKRKETAGNAFVVLLRGCIENYKQPLGYALTATTKNYSDLGNWIDNTIRQLFDAGFIVCAVVSDQGSNFLNLAESKGVSKHSPFFLIDGKKVFYLFDVPHLFKSVRNNLLSYNFHYDGGNEKKIACWSHFEAFYSRDKERNVRMAPKLTDAHLDPNRFQRMKVRYATQAFSYTVSAGMSTYIELGYLPPEAQDTVDFFIKLNNTFDILNSSKVFDPNKFKRAFHGAQYQQECLMDMLEILKSIKAINATTGKDNTNICKAFDGLTMTINGVLQLYETFKSEGLWFFFTRRLNQDPLENFFGAVRQQGGNSREPTPIQFQRAFSKLVLGYLFKKSSLSNCEDDLDIFLLTKDDRTEYFFTKHLTSESAPLAVQTSDYRSDLPTQYALSYVCGYLLKRCSLQHECPDFNKYREHKENNIENSRLFIHFKEFNRTKKNGSLIVPPAHFVSYIEKLENIFVKSFNNVMFTDGAGANLLDAMKKIEFQVPCQCFPIDYLIRLFIRMRIYYALKYNNRNIKSTKMPSFINIKHL